MKPYKIYVLNYARRGGVVWGDMLLGDPHNTDPFEVAYYMWVATNGEDTVVVDIGFTEAMCAKRGRQWLRHPAALLDQVGIDVKTVRHVVVSHMHWDHMGGYDLFPNATFYVQDDEMAFWTGRHAHYPVFSQAIEVEDVVALVRLNYDGRVGFINGSREIVPGITLHRVGGHTKGVQITEVPTASGTAVVASDAVHSYRHLATDTPFTILHDIPGYLDGYQRVRDLAADETHILPGHDSEVMKRLPQVHEGIFLLE